MFVLRDTGAHHRIKIMYLYRFNWITLKVLIKLKTYIIFVTPKLYQIKVHETIYYGHEINH